MPIREYVDRGKGEPFHSNPIQIKTNEHRQARIRNYVHTERRRRQAIRAKQGLNGTITQTLGKWKARKLGASLKKSQQAAGENDMHPIWEFQSKLRMSKTADLVSIKTQDGTECRRQEESLKRLGGWANACLSASQAIRQPRIEQARKGMGEMMTLTQSLREIRQKESMAQITKEEPEAETWLTQEYAYQEIDREL